MSSLADLFRRDFSVVKGCLGGGESEHFIQFSALHCTLEILPEIEGAWVDRQSWIFKVSYWKILLLCRGEKTPWSLHKVSLRVCCLGICRFYCPWRAVARYLAQAGIAQATWCAGCGISLWYIIFVVCFFAVVLAQEEQRCFHTIEFANFNASRRLQVFWLIYCTQVCFK